MGEEVVVVQTSLNRISQNYPAIPKIQPVTGIFGEDTEASVRQFQRIFNLAADGVVGKATWYKLVYLYVGVTRLAELVSEGQTFYKVQFQYPGVLREGDTGTEVQVLQYMLAVLAEFDDAIPPLTVDGVFGSSTANAVRSFQRQTGLMPDGVVGRPPGAPCTGSSPGWRPCSSRTWCASPSRPPSSSPPWWSWPWRRPADTARRPASGSIPAPTCVWGSRINRRCPYHDLTAAGTGDGGPAHTEPAVYAGPALPAL